MPTTLGQLSVGSIVTLRENGVPQNYIVVHQGNPDTGLYDASCDGTWLLRQNIYNQDYWNDTPNNQFITASVVRNYLPNLISIYDVGIAISIKTVKIPYCVGNGSSTINSGANGWRCKLFLLGGYEVGFSQSDVQYLPIDGAKLDYFLFGTGTNANNKRIARLNNNAISWWLRSPTINPNNFAFGIRSIGTHDRFNVGSVQIGIRPAMILPATMTVNDDNSIQNPAIATGQAPVGSIVKVKENGVPVDYIVVNQGIPQNSPLYDSSCDGTWLLRKDIYGNYPWSVTNDTTFTNSAVNTAYLPNVIFPLYDDDLQEVIKQVKVPYCVGNGSSTVNSGENGWECKIFLLSNRELDYGNLGYAELPNDGATVSYFSGTTPNNPSKRIAKYNNSPSNYWSRSVTVSGSPVSVYVNESGGVGSNQAATQRYGIRPAFILPTNLIIDSDNNILSQSFTVTVPSIFMEGQPIPISWTPWTPSTGTITYTIQRNTGSGWEEVATGLSTTTYTDTAQAGWTSVQYQIAAVVDGVAGLFYQSAVIPGIASAVIAISGIDQSLGTLTSNVPYTVVSNTGNPISLTRTVNGAQVVTLTVNSGFAYNIPIFDLPTGTGTIVITASVEDSSQEIQTVTRTWTYYKTPINIPSTGGIAQLTQNGQNIWPVTVPDAVQAPVYLGGNLNAALNKLGQAALYTKIGSPKYNEVTVDLSKVNVGDEVLLPENGKMVSHIVVHIGNPDPSMYDSSCDGVWLLRKDCVAQGQWNSTNVNTLAGSTIMSAMAGYVSQYDSSVSSEIKTVKIPYCIGGGNNTVQTLGNGLECQIFPLGGYEVGWTTSNQPYFPVDGVKLSYFEFGSGISANSKRIAKLNNIACNWWLRSLYTNYTDYVFCVGSNGDHSSLQANSSQGIRPTFILPTTFNHTYYVDSNNNVYPSQEYTTGGSITDVFGYDVPICQYEAGSYVGTGRYGSSNPNTLSFSFTPKVVVITRKNTEGNVYGYGIFTPDNYIGTFVVASGGAALYMPFGKTTFSNNTVSWYYKDSYSPTVLPNYEGQFNAQKTYNYIAIG